MSGDGDQPKLPVHVAIIMDGNGRWAKQRHLPRAMGHRAGQDAVETVIRAAGENKISYLTLFAFSSENWQRPAEEVEGLLKLFVNALDKKVDELREAGVRIRFIGDLERFPASLCESMRAAEINTQACCELNLNVAVGYGGRWEIVEAARKLARDVQAGLVDADSVDEARFAQYTTLTGQPEPDLLIRTGGERRISNFLLWHLAYTEIYFTDCLWPDFDKASFAEALRWFAGRERRFGRLLSGKES